MQPKKQLTLIFFIILCSLALYSCVRIFLENDETRIRRVIYAASLAVERADTEKLNLILSDSYYDPYGNDKVKVIKFMSDFFGKFKDLKVEIKYLKIEAKSSEAQAYIGVKFYFKKPTDEKIYYDAGKFDVNFSKEDNLWRVRRVEYNSSDELLFLQSTA